MPLHTLHSRNLNNFLLAFSTYANLRGAVETIYFDNGLHNVNWVKVLPYTSNHGVDGEIVQKCIKSGL